MLNLKIQDGIPDPHPFLDISWRDLIPQSNHKLQESKQGIRKKCTVSRSHEMEIKRQAWHTFAICFTFITYLASSVLGLIIFVHLATCRRIKRSY
jgi:hypothetical protein